MKRIFKPADIPDGPHTQLIIFKTVNEADGWGGSKDKLAPEIWASDGTDASDAEMNAMVMELETPKRYGANPPYAVVSVAGKCVVQKTLTVAVARHH